MVVGAVQCENHCHRKGKGSLTMKISQGVIDPNLTPNRREGKGQQVNIPVLSEYAWQHKSCFRLFRLDRHILSDVLTEPNQGSCVM